MPYEDIYKGLTEEEKERMLKMFLGHNTQKTYRIIV